MAFQEYRNFNGSIGIGEDSDKNSFLKEINSESVFFSCGLFEFRIVCFLINKTFANKNRPKSLKI